MSTVRKILLNNNSFTELLLSAQTNKTNIIKAIIETKTSVLFEDVFTMQFETLMRTAVTKTNTQAVTAAR